MRLGCARRRSLWPLTLAAPRAMQTVRVQCLFQRVQCLFQRVQCLFQRVQCLFQPEQGCLFIRQVIQRKVNHASVYRQGSLITHEPKSFIFFVVVSRDVTAPSQPDQMTRILLLVDQTGRGEIARRVTRAAQRGCISLRTVNDSRFMQTAFIRLQFKINGLVFVDLVRFDLGREDVAVGVGDRFIVGEATRLTAGDNAHAAIVFCRLVNHQPDRADAGQG